MPSRKHRTKHKPRTPNHPQVSPGSSNSNSSTSGSLLRLLRESLPDAIGGLIAQAVVTVITLLYAISGISNVWLIILMVELVAWLFCLFLLVKRPSPKKAERANYYNSANLRFIAHAAILFIPLITANCVLSLQLLRGNASIINLTLLAGIVISMWVGYFWVMLRKNPAKRAQSPRFSLSVGHASRWLTRSLLAIVLFSSLLPLSVTAVYYWPPSNTIILLADFDGPEPDKYRVTDTILARLQGALRPYKDVEIRTLGHAIREAEGSSVARAEGAKEKAAIVIWGWYGTTTPPLISVHFELLRRPQEFPELGPDLEGEVKAIDSARLDSPSLQIQLSSEMAYLSLFTIGMTRYSVEDWDEAIKRFTDALAQIQIDTIVTDRAWALLYRGNAYIFKEDTESYDKALADFEEIVKIQPGNPEGYTGRGLVYARKGDYGKAIEEYDHALSLRPNDFEALNRRGNSYFYRKEYDKAIDDYGKAIAVQPDSGTVLYNRANAYTEMGEYDKAVADYNSALKIHPDYVLYYYRRGEMHIKKGDYYRAIADFNSAIYYQSGGGSEGGSESSQLYHVRGQAYYYNKQYNNAIADYTRAIRIKPNYVVLFDRGNAYLATKQYSRAITDYTDSMKLTQVYDLVVGIPDKDATGGHKEEYRTRFGEDKLAKAYYARGLAYMQSGDSINSINDFRKVVELNTDDRLINDAKNQLAALGVN